MLSIHFYFEQEYYDLMVERSNRMRSTGEGNGKPLQYSCLENPMKSMKRQKDMTLNRYDLNES